MVVEIEWLSGCRNSIRAQQKNRFVEEISIEGLEDLFDTWIFQRQNVTSLIVSVYVNEILTYSVYNIK